MPSAASLRARIESDLALRIPGALSPTPRIMREFVPTGIASVDQLLGGGFPAGAITEVVGPECSGRTSLALSLVASLTSAEKVCAWVDVSNALHPESAAAAGVDLQKLLWVRCGNIAVNHSPVLRNTAFTESRPANAFTVSKQYFVPRPVKKGLHGGGFGPHPRGEAKGISKAIAGLLRPEEKDVSYLGDRKLTPKTKPSELHNGQIFESAKETRLPAKPWSRLEQALRVTDLLLQNGGFSAVVLDMGSVVPEHALRVPLATWFRYRAVAEQKRSSVVLLLQHPCAKSSAALTLRLHAGNPLLEEPTVFCGFEHYVEVERQRFSVDAGGIVPLRKPPQTQRWVPWSSRTAWTGR